MGFPSGAAGSSKGIRRFTFHPHFPTSAFSLPLLCCGVLSNRFAPPRRQPQRLQRVSNCYRDHLQSFGVLPPPDARLMDGDSLTLSTSSSPPSEMKPVGTSIVAAQRLAELSYLEGGCFRGISAGGSRDRETGPSCPPETRRGEDSQWGWREDSRSWTLVPVTG